MIVGIDEVGRGAWAGPLCVAAVGLGGKEIAGLTDSKKLSKKKRQELSLIIKQTTSSIGIGWVSAAEIDRIGISEALKRAAMDAFSQVDNGEVKQVIIDGTIRLIDDARVTTMKQADMLVPSVSAASIIAKVARDSYMQMLDTAISGYKFTSHVGYGTQAHHEALKTLGVSPVHRKSFLPMRDMLDGQVISPKQSLKSVSQHLTAGHKAEVAVANYLMSNGYSIIDTNWKTKVCEIDIIAKKCEVIHFVEVKYRKNDSQGGGIAAISPKKLKQMQFAARVWLHHNGPHDSALSAAEVTGSDYKITKYIDQVQL